MPTKNKLDLIEHLPTGTILRWPDGSEVITTEPTVLVDRQWLKEAKDAEAFVRTLRRPRVKRVK